MSDVSTSAADLHIPPALRRYLYATAAVTGAAILVVEILGAKMLSPYVGTSHFVWTAQIAVTLVSLAAGYWFGGWLVDRSMRLRRLYTCIALAAVYLCLTVLICQPVAYWGLRYSLATGALLASAVLFFVPLTLLAVTGPFLVRVLTRSVDAVGGHVGTISAVSTLGSVSGTVLIGYVLIPYLRNSVTMYLTAAALMAVVAGYFLVFGRGRGDRGGAGFAAMGVGLLLGYGGVVQDGVVRFATGTQIFRANSNFGQLQVVQVDERLYFLNDYFTQDIYDARRHQSADTFTWVLRELARAYTARIDDALCIGLGVGLVPMELARAGVRVEAVEINPAMVDVAVRFFDFDPALIDLTIGDGRQFLNQTPRTYDVIILDAFLGDSSPSHLMTREAFAAMRRVLRPGGVLVINTFGSFQPGHDFLTAALDDTLRAVFQSVRIHTDGSGTFFVAADRPALTFVTPPQWGDAPLILRTRLETRVEAVQQVDGSHGLVLTDDYNPVEFRDAANREQLRRHLAFAMRAGGE